MPTDEELNRVTGQIIDAAYRVHSTLGPGLVESAYQACMEYELTVRGLHVEPNLTLPLRYGPVQLDAAYRIDLRVERSVIVELKAVTKLQAVHIAQLLSYLRLSGSRIGLLLNFHENLLKNGITRLIHTPTAPGTDGSWRARRILPVSFDKWVSPPDPASAREQASASTDGDR